MFQGEKELDFSPLGVKMISRRCIMDNLVRKNIRMSNDIANWYESRAKSLGVSQSNLMVMALAEYIKQENTINMMSQFEGIVEKLESASSNEK